MKLTSVVILALAAGGALAGCARPDLQADQAQNVAQAEGIRVRLDIPQRYYATGQDIQVTVTATNTTGKAIQIYSPTGAPVLVRLTRHTRMYPEQVRVYPQSATTNILSYTLPGGESRRYSLRVPVEPDWPVNEILFLSAELNGYPQIAPGVAIMVKQPLAGG